MRILLVCIGLMISLLPYRSVGQTGESFVVETIGLRQGLPTSDIHTLFRDTNGYLWLGTDIGLVRYDGYGFETISVSKEGRWLGLVNAMIEGNDGSLWVGTEDGLFLVRHGVAYAVPSLQTDPFLRISCLLFDKKQRLWCGTSSGVYSLEPSDWQAIVRSPASPIRPKPLPGYEQFVPKPEHQRVLSMAFDGLGRLYVGAYYGLFRYTEADSSDGTSHSGTHLKRLWPNEHRKVEIQALAVRGADDVVFTTYDPLCYIRLHQGREEKLFPGIYSTDVVCHQNQFWYLSYGLHRQGPADSRPVSMLDLYPITRGNFNKLYIDDEGIFWVASNEGLLKIRRSLFQSVPLPPSISGREINGLGLYANQLLIGAHHGRVFTWAGNKLQQKLADLVPIAGVSGIRQDSHGILWLGTTYQGLFSFDGQKIHRYTRSDGVENNAFNDIIEAPSGDLWALGEVGITRIRYNQAANKPYQLTFYEHRLNRYKFTVFYSGLADSEETLWLASDAGLVSFRNGRFQNHLLTINRTTVRSVRKLARDQSGNVWLATEGTGLLQGKLVNGTFRLIRQYTTRDGLPSNTVTDVLVDHQERIWAGSSTGLSCLKVGSTTTQISNFDYKDGFFGESFQNPRLFEYPNGTLWIGSSEGLLRFSLAQRSESIKALPPLITQVRLREEGDDIFAYAETKNARSGLPIGCQFPPSRNALTFAFALPSLTNPSFNRYRFRLDGSGESWRTTSGSDRSVTYAGLKPGSYTFRMVGASANGVWSSVVSFPFEILPPFWQRAWFVGLVLAGLSVGVWGFIRYREKQIKRREVEKNRLAQLIAELETRAIRAQMNPHFIFNCLNSIQECILADNTETAYRYLSKFSRLLRMVLEESARNFHAIQHELELIRLYLELESMRFDQPMHYSIEVDPTIDTLNWQIPSLLLQPLVENAIWHGLIHQSGPRQLRLEIRQSENQTLTCLIEDNGVGRQRAAELAANKLITRTTRGLALVTERLQLLEPAGHGRGTLQIEDLVDAEGQPAGTCARVQLPIITQIAVRASPFYPPAYVSRSGN